MSGRERFWCVLLDSLFSDGGIWFSIPAIIGTLYFFVQIFMGGIGGDAGLDVDLDFDGEIDVDLSGQPVTRAPEWMGSVEGIYQHGIFGDSNMDWRLRVSYEDESVSSYSDVSPAFNTTLQSRTLVDASVTYYFPEDKWYVRLLGSNLTDERYRSGSLSVGATWIMSAYAPPRYWGLEVGGRFGQF